MRKTKADDEFEKQIVRVVSLYMIPMMLFAVLNVPYVWGITVICLLIVLVAMGFSVGIIENLLAGHKRFKWYEVVHVDVLKTRIRSRSESTRKRR